MIAIHWSDSKRKHSRARARLAGRKCCKEIGHHVYAVDTKNTIKMDYMCTSCEYKVNTYTVNTKREININTNRNMFHSRINRTLDPDEDVLTTLKIELHEGNIS